GMQLGGGCASGTLFAVGGGNTRMLVTLRMFIVGSVVGAARTAWWNATPALPATSIVTVLGPWFGLAVSFALFGGIALVTRRADRQRPRPVVCDPATTSKRRWLRGPWPLVAGAVGLALVNIATLMIGGRPWGVTSAFALWGAKAYTAMGGDVSAGAYWATPAQANALKSSVLVDVTSVMDFGIILGALTASMLAGRFAPNWKISGRSLAAAVLGGLMLGYGARIAYGCNIGAYFSGIASGSLHGWLWLGAAFCGSLPGKG